MIKLTRNVGQQIVIGDDIVVKVLHSGEGVVSLGIKAPREIPVWRLELWERLQEQAAKQVDK